MVNRRGITNETASPVKLCSVQSRLQVDFFQPQVASQVFKVAQDSHADALLHKAWEYKDRADLTRINSASAPTITSLIRLIIKQSLGVLVDQLLKRQRGQNDSFPC